MISRIIKFPEKTSFFLFGPRGVGKTKLLRTHFKESIYFDLLDGELFTQLSAKPSRLADWIPKEYTGWVVLDEIQRIPDLLNEVHRLIEKRGIKFAMTGSSARKLRKQGVNLLAGRALTLRMYPLTFIELKEQFDLPFYLSHGGLPSVWNHESPRDYLKSYTLTYLREEVQQEGLVRNLNAFTRFLEAATFSQSQILNMATVSRECGVQEKSVQQYFQILEDLFIAHRISVFNKKPKRKLVTHPKFYFFDCGVYESLRPKGILDQNGSGWGIHFESFIFQNLLALNESSGNNYSISYWRSQKGEEVDFILHGNNDLIALEIKSTSRIRDEDFKGLQEFGIDYPHARRLILYPGQRSWIEKDIEVITLQEFQKIVLSVFKLPLLTP